MVEPGAMFLVRNGIIVAALKSGITLIRTRPEAWPRFSTATRTRAARRSLSCRLPRSPACSPPGGGLPTSPASLHRIAGHRLSLPRQNHGDPLWPHLFGEHSCLLAA